MGQRVCLRESDARVGKADSTLHQARVLSIPSQIYSCCHAFAGLPWASEAGSPGTLPFKLFGVSR